MKKALFSWLQFSCLFLVMGRSTQVQKEANAIKQSSFFTAILFLLCWALCGCGAEALYYGAYALGAADILLPEGGSGGKKKSNDNDIIEEHVIGENTVRLHITTYQGRPGYLFIAYDCSHQELGKVFYYVGDEGGMIRYKRFKKMNTAEKKQFILEDFLKYANVDLAQIESEEVDAVTEAKSDSSL